MTGAWYGLPYAKLIKRQNGCSRGKKNNRIFHVIFIVEPADEKATYREHLVARTFNTIL
jgi:hypothetical protein